MVYGELGIYPIEIDVKVRIISFWTNYDAVKNQNYQLLCTNFVSKCQLRIDVVFCG
jgi:hypothetical protein